jgi:hypothetical protein
MARNGSIPAAAVTDKPSNHILAVAAEHNDGIIFVRDTLFPCPHFVVHFPVWSSISNIMTSLWSYSFCFFVL